MRETPTQSRVAGLPERRPRLEPDGLPKGALFSEKIVEGRLGLLDFGDVLRDISAFLGLKVIAKIGLVLLTDLLGRRLLAVLCLRGVVFDAHLTDVELGIARLAHVETAKGGAQCG
jgi:polyferredoxin